MQVGFLVLLGVCAAQLTYWLADEVVYTRTMQAALRETYLTDAAAAQAMLREGTRWERLSEMYPDLAISTDSVVSVKPSAMAALDAQRWHRLNRYTWEGGFFLMVLLSAMAVVYRGLRDAAALRARQDHFLDAVSHELKSPLASLRLSAETLALRDPPPERRAELVQRMLGDLRRLERMDTNVLEASRLESGEATDPAEPVALASTVAAVVDEVRDHAIEHSVNVAADIPAALVISADEDRVRLVLRNLLYNAVRAASGNGHVTVSARVVEGFARLEVRDDGIGFPPEAASRLFVRFYRIEGSEPARMGGTGLGLYLVRRCVELDRGTVVAASPGPGKGAVFTVVWRLAAVEAA